jgi:hypothetical protein
MGGWNATNGSEKRVPNQEKNLINQKKYMPAISAKNQK